ncbi:HigA family addiction module antitoxin [Oceanospirillum sp.]|uniref:HigA family addiction module antitoxin n=1 Tax=Oceanospirillum sp. TaxID=2021254 RepID=UPI003A956DBF
MNMHNPPHPGEFIESIYMEPHGISCRTLATHLGVAASTLNRVVKGKSAVTPAMALRRSPESWLSMQDNYELWQAKQNINLDNVQPIDLHAA